MNEFCRRKKDRSVASSELTRKKGSKQEKRKVNDDVTLSAVTLFPVLH